MRVTLALNAFEPSSWTRHEVPDLRAFLVESFPGGWPKTARIYQGEPSRETDVTPVDPHSVERLASLPGPFFVVVYPAGGALDVVSWVAAPFWAASEWLGLQALNLFRPKIPSTQAYPSSPNNSISERGNTQRLGGRIPDIFGKVRSYPDLLGVPYRVYEGNTEVEHSFMCIGRGDYDIDADSIREGTTPVTDVDGSALFFYGPNQSPKNASPLFTVGNSIGTPDVKTVRKIGGVNGQQIISPNVDFWTSADVIEMEAGVSGGIYFFHLQSNSSQDFTNAFVSGMTILVGKSGGTDLTTTTGVNLAGTYVVDKVTSSYLWLHDAASVNSNWTSITSSTPINKGSLITGWGGESWTGPFQVDAHDATQVSLNLLAPGGLYVLNSEADNPQSAFNITLQVKVVPTDAAGNPTGAGTILSYTMNGASNVRYPIGLTIQQACSGYCQVSVRSVTGRDHPWDHKQWTYQDQIQWTALYAFSPVSQAHFGNVTTVYSITRATKEARDLQERKLNMLVTRKIPHCTDPSSGTFTAPQASVNAGDILVAAALDSYIGRRTVEDLDLVNIYATIAEIEVYFPGAAACSQFNYTWDQDNTSFEETVTQIATAIFCTPYRLGRQLRLHFEKLNPDSVLLFNHRNKVPGTETRSVRFGNQDDYDGVEFSYVSPADDTVKKIILDANGENGSPLNPQKIDSVGVRSRVQAYYLAWRAWNKIRYQNYSVQFEATEEADLLAVMDRILVADNTRPDTMDGDVVAQSGLQLTLSRPVTI